MTAAPAESLCTLPGPALSIIIQQISSADRKRLASTCHTLRHLCKQAVQEVLLSQQDLEDWADDALAAFSQLSHLQLTDVSLGTDCVLELQHLAPELLHGLKGLQVINPTWLAADALLQLASTCSSLTGLYIRGSWSIDSSSLLQDAARHMPQKLQRLVLQRNSNLDLMQLMALLSAQDTSNHNSSSASSGRGGGGSSMLPAEGAAAVSSTVECCIDCASNSRQRQLPQWCRALVKNCTELGEESVSSIGSAGTPMPSLWQLTELDLTGCPKIGGSLVFLGLCPSLLSLRLHSCFKVTDAVLKELSTALQYDRNSLSNPSESTVTTSNHHSSTQAALADADSSTADPVPLQQLDLSYTRVKDAGMPHLVAALPGLSNLGLKGCNVGDDGLDHLVRLQHLTALHIKHCHRVTDEGIQGLSSLSQLRSLSYGYTSMPEANDVVAAIAHQFTALTALDLLASELTDTGLAALSKLSQLRELKLYQAGVTADGLEGFAGQPAGAALHSLVLYGTGALRELSCLGAIAGLQQLQLGRLCDLSTPMITALRHLTTIQRLNSLTLERMDDVSVGVLQHILKGCRELQLLRVRGCDGVCQEDMEELAQDAAGLCGSSASVWWAAAPSCDTDDEEEGWQMLQP